MLKKKAATRCTGSEYLRDTRLSTLNHAVLYLKWGGEVAPVSLRFANCRKPK